jgi:hypothetical protein
MKSQELTKLKNEQIGEAVPAYEANGNMFRLSGHNQSHGAFLSGSAHGHGTHKSDKDHEWTVRQDIRIRPVRAIHQMAGLLVALFISSSMPSFAEESENAWSFSDETTIYAPLDFKSVGHENETILGYENGIWTFTFENCFGADNLVGGTVQCEDVRLTAGTTIADLFFLQAGPFASFLTRIPGYGAFVLGSISWEKDDLSISDDNEFDLLFDGFDMTYVNTFSASIAFGKFGLGFENEMALPFMRTRELADGFSIGPFVTLSHLTMSLNYTLTVVPSIANGIEIGVLAEF